ncbi:MAG TPA: Zn-ribbon domain-containing OB-fold protein [Polyangiales bacterium]|nr:Zn-ribbon domain-containing OB-fold protein [Polyangiales bacterium]
MTDKTPVPAVEGLFTMDPVEPRLLGTQCRGCGTYFFPAERTFCRNPNCDEADLVEVTLSRIGKVWSYTSANYKPPPPFVADEPFEPFAIAAVELEKEGITILGRVADGAGTDALRTGMRVELVLRRLYEDDAHTYLTWSWKPVDEKVGAP